MTGQMMGHCGQPVGWPIVKPVWWQNNGSTVRMTGRLKKQ